MGVKILLNYQLKNEVSQANFDIYKRIYNWQPFMKRVYLCLFSRIARFFFLEDISLFVATYKFQDKQSSCMYVCTYVRMYVCTYVRMYVCTYVRMYVCTYVRMYVCTYVRMYVCTYIRMYVCMYVRTYVRTHVRRRWCRYLNDRHFATNTS